MGILAKHAPEWSAEMLIEQFLYMDDKKLIYQSGDKSSNYPRVKKAMELLMGKELVRISAQNDKFTVYEYVGETKA